MTIERITPEQGQPEATPCACEETRIAYKRPDGVTALAPVSIRCAEHRNARRAADNTRREGIAALFRSIVRPFPLALPAPEVCRG